MKETTLFLIRFVAFAVLWFLYKWLLMGQHTPGAAFQSALLYGILFSLLFQAYLIVSRWFTGRKRANDH